MLNLEKVMQFIEEDGGYQELRFIGFIRFESKDSKGNVVHIDCVPDYNNPSHYDIYVNDQLGNKLDNTSITFGRQKS